MPVLRQAFFDGLRLVVIKLDPDDFILFPGDVLLAEIVERMKTFAAGPVHQNQADGRRAFERMLQKLFHMISQAGLA